MIIMALVGCPLAMAADIMTIITPGPSAMAGMTGFIIPAPAIMFTTVAGGASAGVTASAVIGRRATSAAIGRGGLAVPTGPTVPADGTVPIGPIVRVAGTALTGRIARIVPSRRNAAMPPVGAASGAPCRATRVLRRPPPGRHPPVRTGLPRRNRVQTCRRLGRNRVRRPEGIGADAHRALVPRRRNSAFRKNRADGRSFARPPHWRVEPFRV